MGLRTCSDVCIDILPVCPVPAGVAATVHYYSILEQGADLLGVISTSIVYPCYVYILYAETLSQ